MDHQAGYKPPRNNCKKTINSPYLGYPSPGLLFILHPGKRVIVRCNVCHNTLLVRSTSIDVFGIQQPGYAQFVVGNVEGMVQVIYVL